MNKRIVNMVLAFLLVFMVVVSPALAEEIGGYTVVHGGANDDEQVDDSGDDSGASVKDSDSITDKIISDDKVLGFKRNTDYDLSKDLNLDTGFEIASSLPPWAVLVVFILILAVLVILAVIFVVEWNTLKGAKSATNENPEKAAKGIKDSRSITRAYLMQVAEGIGGLGVFLFCVWLVFM